VRLHNDCRPDREGLALSSQRRTTDSAEYARKVIKDAFIFSVLSDPEVSELAGAAALQHFQADEFIFFEGGNPDRLFILAEGQVKVIKHSPTGRDFTVAFFNPGEMFGEVAVFENKPYPASAQATGPATSVSIPKKDFLNFLARRPEVALRIIAVLGGRLRDSQSRLKDLAVERVDQRLASILQMLSAKFGPTLPFTRQELAEMAGTTTETAIRTIIQFKKMRIIETTRGKITITAPDRLKALAEGANS
jgi:CRP-like cAMP-binding protein